MPFYFFTVDFEVPLSPEPESLATKKTNSPFFSLWCYFLFKDRSPVCPPFPGSPSTACCGYSSSSALSEARPYLFSIGWQQPWLTRNPRQPAALCEQPWPWWGGAVWGGWDIESSSRGCDRALVTLSFPTFYTLGYLERQDLPLRGRT